MYKLMVKCYAQINGGIRPFGEKAVDEYGNELFLTLLEVEELKNQNQIIDPVSRKIPHITLIVVENNKCKHPIVQKHLDQLQNIGCDISKLRYELKQD